jgi:hypothetical protein
MDLASMAWFLRAMEQQDGGWQCRWGSHTYDVHNDLGEALAHLRELATLITPSELFVHRADGTTEHLGPL